MRKCNGHLSPPSSLKQRPGRPFSGVQGPPCFQSFSFRRQHTPANKRLKGVNTPSPRRERGQGGEVTIADIGTGCGAIAVALARAVPRAVIYATDVSAGAIEVARTNAKRHDVANRIAFRRGDLLEPVPVYLDLIVANLPYVDSEDLKGLEPEVRDHEPRLALAGGADGLDLIRRLLRQAPHYLRPRGAIIFEFGRGQAEALEAAAREAVPDAVIDVRSDLAGLPRVLLARV